MASTGETVTSMSTNTVTTTIIRPKSKYDLRDIDGHKHGEDHHHGEAHHHDHMSRSRVRPTSMITRDAHTTIRERLTPSTTGRLMTTRSRHEHGQTC